MAIMTSVSKFSKTSKRLRTTFEAFKFPASDMVQFRALITPCLSSCKPVQCNLLNTETGVNQEFISYGRRRKRSMSSPPTTPEPLPKPEVVVMGAIKIRDNIDFRKENNRGGKRKGDSGVHAAHFNNYPDSWFSSNPDDDEFDGDDIDEEQGQCTDLISLTVAGMVFLFGQLTLLAAWYYMFQKVQMYRAKMSSLGVIGSPLPTTYRSPVTPASSLIDSPLKKECNISHSLVGENHSSKSFPSKFLFPRVSSPVNRTSGHHGQSITNNLLDDCVSSTPNNHRSNRQNYHHHRCLGSNTSSPTSSCHNNSNFFMLSPPTTKLSPPSSPKTHQLETSDIWRLIRCRYGSIHHSLQITFLSMIHLVFFPCLSYLFLSLPYFFRLWFFRYFIALFRCIIFHFGISCELLEVQKKKEKEQGRMLSIVLSLTVCFPSHVVSSSSSSLCIMTPSLHPDNGVLLKEKSIKHKNKTQKRLMNLPLCVFRDLHPFLSFPSFPLVWLTFHNFLLSLPHLPVFLHRKAHLRKTWCYDMTWETPHQQDNTLHRHFSLKETGDFHYRAFILFSFCLKRSSSPAEREREKHRADVIYWFLSSRCSLYLLRFLSPFSLLFTCEMSSWFSFKRELLVERNAAPHSSPLQRTFFPSCYFILTRCYKCMQKHDRAITISHSIVIHCSGHKTKQQVFARLPSRVSTHHHSPSPFIILHDHFLSIWLLILIFSYFCLVFLKSC